MCNDVVMEDPLLLRHIPDWFVTQQRLRQCDDYYGEDKFIEWYDGYQKCKAQKARIKEELLPITWHTDRVMDWCVPEDEKQKL